MIIIGLGIVLSTITSCMGDADIIAYVWEDTNCNGVSDEGEPPMAGVKMTYFIKTTNNEELPTVSISKCNSYPEISNSEGYWISPFVSNSGKSIYVLACPPSGYTPTTPLVQNGCRVSFGFAELSSCPSLHQEDPTTN